MKWSRKLLGWLAPHRKFGYVEFASEEDRTKALELNGKKVLGQEMKLDMPRSKESNQEGKKGGGTLPLCGFFIFLFFLDVE